MALSENSVPLQPMVNDHYPYSMAIFLGVHHGIPHFQTSQIYVGYLGFTLVVFLDVFMGWLIIGFTKIENMAFHVVTL